MLWGLVIYIFPNYTLILTESFQFVDPLVDSSFPAFSFPTGTASNLLISKDLLMVPRAVSGSAFLVAVSFLSFFAAGNRSLLASRLFCADTLLDASFVRLAGMVMDPSIVSLSGS